MRDHGRVLVQKTGTMCCIGTMKAICVNNINGLDDQLVGVMVSLDNLYILRRSHGGKIATKPDPL